MQNEDDLKTRALEYHALPRPGKIGIEVTKPAATQEDLTLAYSPGVAAPVRAIANDEEDAYKYTNKGNLVLIVTDGTAVLGLGNTGALASKPVMEGKSLLFKIYANVDVFDIEVKCDGPEEFIETVVRIAPGFGGINLEDIAAPHCFEIENRLNKKLDIPVFHDDQHGTAVITAAGLTNALYLQEKAIEDVRVVCTGAGAAGIACMKLLIHLGAKRENIYMVDRKGVITKDRNDLNDQKREFANPHTDIRTLEQAMDGADVLVGVSGPGIISKEMIASMAPRPVVFALSNPDPEINPHEVKAVRDDAIMATGRSDYPNQVNNVLGFPYIFRGALDVQATTINQDMLIAAVEALRDLARTPVPQRVLEAYGLDELEFGPEYIIPKPNDPRLIETLPPAISRAAIKSKVARVIPPGLQIEDDVKKV
ncbi:MAG: malic enzyme-like NAD(P)-binding protein [Pseudomonadota bacterium]